MRHRGVDHQVVAGAHFDGERRAGEPHRRRERRDAAARARRGGRPRRRGSTTGTAAACSTTSGATRSKSRMIVGQCSGLTHDGVSDGSGGCRRAPAGGRCDVAGQSTLAPDSLTTLPQRTSLVLDQRGELLGRAAERRRRLRRRASCAARGSCSALLNSALSLATTSLGVPAGASRPNQVTASKPL